MGKGVWEKHQKAVQSYEEALQAYKAAEEGGEGTEEGGISAEQRSKSYHTAGLSVVQQLVEKLIVERAADLVLEVNSGKRDPPDLEAVLVLEVQEEEEIITEPVLKALRRFDGQRENRLELSCFKGFLSALDEDELEVGTHRCYAELADTEVDRLTGSMQQSMALGSDGRLEYASLKAFLENQDVPDKAGESAKNLVSCLVGMSVEDWLAGGDVGVFWSPRSWRARLRDTDLAAAGSAGEDSLPQLEKSDKRKASSSRDR